MKGIRWNTSCSTGSGEEVHMVPQSLRNYLDARQVPYRVLPHAHSPTAQETAHAAHVSGRRLAKVVLMRRSASPGFLVAVLPANEKIDLGRLSEELGESVTLAAESEFERLFPEFEAGAAPPLGELAGVPVVADACLARQDSIVFNGGTHTDLIEMAWNDFARLAAPRICDYGRR
jgi:Ala-tRNA(Pro) deacylase